MTNDDIATLEAALQIANEALAEVSAYDVAALLKLEEAKREIEEKIASIKG
tara:strand:+ start:214 stop:366 length:153 start_codon:yes stop_codon:yes gene_type:complete